MLSTSFLKLGWKSESCASKLRCFQKLRKKSWKLNKNCYSESVINQRFRGSRRCWALSESALFHKKTSAEIGLLSVIFSFENFHFQRCLELNQRWLEIFRYWTALNQNWSISASELIRLGNVGWSVYLDCSPIFILKAFELNQKPRRLLTR